ncbi:hypothetical protein ACFQ68_12075 [Amycolatopsis japonica]|uniref:hypothetical protein n=1 Tax=Amycolatopsis japonica TaxID=208439 RepID=UPI0036717E2C
MFASVLREAAGYLDRRALVSAFFPVVVFLGTTVAVVWSTLKGISGAISTWSTFSGLAQAGTIVAFIVLCAFLSFVVGTLREWQDRMVQGFWPTWAKGLETRLIRTQKRRRQELLDDDDRLRHVEEALAAERYVFPRADTLRPTPMSDDEIDRKIAALAAPRAGSPWPAGTAQHAADIANALVGEESERAIAFTSLLRDLDSSLSTEEQRVEEDRAVVHQELFLTFPQPPRGVLPTRFGNVVRAAEQHPAVRYRLDAAVWWTRLQPLLPRGFDDSVKDAKVAVDLLLTVAAFLPLFGIPLSWWLAARLPHVTGSPAAWITYVAIVVCATAIFMLARRALARITLIPCIAALVLLTFVPIALRIEIAVMWPAAILVVAYGLYRNAVHAALAYTERLRTAFDLYRWKILEELRIDLPQTLDEERNLWNDLSQFVHRGGMTAHEPTRYSHPAPGLIRLELQRPTSHDRSP